MPANATSGSAPDFSAGSRSSRKLILSCEPDGLVSASSPSPSRIRSTHGATPASTRRPVTECWRSPSCQTTSAPSGPGVIALTPAPVRISAPASTAAFASASVTAPMPPIGTRHSPVPLPIRW